VEPMSELRMLRVEPMFECENVTGNPCLNVRMLQLMSECEMFQLMSELRMLRGTHV
jgi:hypothetical protein